MCGACTVLVDGKPVSRYLTSFGDFDSLSTDLIKRFKFLGAMGAYYFLYVVGERVPPHEEWLAAHQPASRAAPRTRTSSGQAKRPGQAALNSLGAGKLWAPGVPGADYPEH